MTWIGPSTGGSWATATNWSTGAVPGGTDSVCLPTVVNVTVSSAAAVADVQGAGASLTVNGSLVLRDAACVSRIGGLTQSGTVTTAGQLRVNGSLSMNGRRP